MVELHNYVPYTEPKFYVMRFYLWTAGGAGLVSTVGARSGFPATNGSTPQGGSIYDTIFFTKRYGTTF